MLESLVLLFLLLEDHALLFVLKLQAIEVIDEVSVLLGFYAVFDADAF